MIQDKRLTLVSAAKLASYNWDRDIIKASQILIELGATLDVRYPSKCDVYDAIIELDPLGAQALSLPSVKAICEHTFPPMRGNITFFLSCYIESVDKDGTITV